VKAQTVEEYLIEEKPVVCRGREAKYLLKNENEEKMFNDIREEAKKAGCIGAKKKRRRKTKSVCLKLQLSGRRKRPRRRKLPRAKDGKKNPPSGKGMHSSERENACVAIGCLAIS